MSMAGFGAISYAAVGVSYATLSVMLLISWRGKHPGGYLIAACLISAVWAIMLSVQTANTFVPVMAMFAVEVLRDRAWLTFLMALAAQIGVSHQLRYLMHAVWISVLVVGIVWWLGQDYFGPTINVGAVAIPSGLAMALAGLLLIEQLYRISPLE